MSEPATAAPQWQDIATAPKDGTPVLLRFKDRIPREREDIRRWEGLSFVGSHPGVCSDGFDIGWRFAGPVGLSGFPDEWLVGWLPLPPPPVSA